MDVQNKLYKKLIHSDWFLILILIITTFSCYSFGLYHVPRSDMLDYLIDSLNFTGISGFLGSLSYNRVRLIRPGDSELFRPVHFLLLYLITYFRIIGNIFIDQLFNLLLHIVNSILLFLILKKSLNNFKYRYKKELIFIVTIFFSCNPFIAELVYWSHMVGYVFFITLFYSIILILLSKESHENNFLLYALLIILTYTYELGVLVPLILALVLLVCRDVCLLKVSKKFLTVIKLCIIPISYFLINTFDYYYRYSIVQSSVSKAEVINKFLLCKLDDFVRTISYLVVQPLFPQSYNATITQQRTYVGESIFISFNSMKIFQVLLVFMTLLAYIYVCIIAVKYNCKKNNYSLNNNALKVKYLLIATLVAYVVMIAVGRVSVGDYNSALSANSYYPYISFAIFVCLIPYAIQNYRGKVPLVALFIILFINSSYGIIKTYEIGKKRYELDATQYKNLIKINKYIQQNDPNAKYYFDEDSKNLIAGSAYGLSLARIYFDNYALKLDSEYHPITAVSYDKANDVLYFRKIIYEDIKSKCHLLGVYKGLNKYNCNGIDHFVSNSIEEAEIP